MDIFIIKDTREKIKKNVKGMCEIAHIISWHFTKAQLLSCIYTDYQNDGVMAIISMSGIRYCDAMVNTKK